MQDQAPGLKILSFFLSSSFCVCVCRKSLPQQHISVFICLHSGYMGRDSSGGIVTRYEPDGPGIKFWWGRYFPHLSTPALGPAQPPGGKAAGAWR